MMNCVGIKTMANTVEWTQDEWDELLALKNAISYNPATVSSDKMELFTQLLIKSFEHRGEAFLDVELTK